MGRVEVSSLSGATIECETDQLLRLAAERDENGCACLWLGRAGAAYPLLAVHLKDGLGVAERIDQDPMRSGGDVEGSETFITVGDGSIPAGQQVEFTGLGPTPEWFDGQVIVSEARVLGILRAFADELDWPPGTAWFALP